jgi:hypothetical protein
MLVKNKTILVFLAIAVIMLSGCAVQRQAVQEVQTEPAIQESEEPIANQVLTPQTTAATEDNEQETTTAATTEKETSEAKEGTTSGYDFESMTREQQLKIKLVRKLLASARTSNENYFFRYSDNKVLQSDVWVNGDMVKRAILRLDEVDKTHTYNMVYMNKKTLAAQGYCETTKSACPKGHGPFDETYDTWKIKTPKDWITEVGDEFYWTLDNKVADVLYHIIDYKRTDGTTLRLYINDYKGWPGKVEVFPKGKVDSIPGQGMKPLETYVYDDMDIGGVSEDDVKPGG